MFHLNRSEIFSIPNTISFFRILLVVPILVYFYAGKVSAAMALALIGFVSDFLDGYLARRLKQTTRTGAIIDPFADRLLVVATASGMVVNSLVPAISFYLLILRELLAVSGFILLRSFFKLEMKPDKFGKNIAATVYAALIVTGFLKANPIVFNAALLLYYLSLLNYLFYVLKFKRGQERR